MTLLSKLCTHMELLIPFLHSCCWEYMILATFRIEYTHFPIFSSNLCVQLLHLFEMSQVNLESSLK